jgi:porphobilinogen synthase
LDQGRLTCRGGLLRAILESLSAFKRAGAAGVITYFAPQAARVLGA